MCYDLNMCSSCPDITLDNMMYVILRLMLLIYIAMICRVMEVLLGWFWCYFGRWLGPKTGKTLPKFLKNNLGVSQFGDLRYVRKEINYVKFLERTLLLIRGRMILSGG